MKLTGLFLLISLTSTAQHDIVGNWDTVDDETGEVKATVEIFERSGALYGKIVKIMNREHPDPICEECPEDDDRFKKKIMGMEIIRGLKKSGDHYDDGNVLDPQDGKVYRCKIWIEGENLMVRGYWGPFFKTQTWRKSS